MAEWHLPPDYIVDNWTDELLELMIEKLVERRTRDTPPSGPVDTRPGVRRVSDATLFRMMGNKVKVNKPDGN